MFCLLSPGTLTSLFDRSITASSVFLVTPRVRQGWFQGGHLLGASTSISNRAGTLSNYRAACNLISAFFHMLSRIFLLVKDKRNAAMHEARLCPRQNILWILDSPDYYFQPSFFCLLHFLLIRRREAFLDDFPFSSTMSFGAAFCLKRCYRHFRSADLLCGLIPNLTNTSRYDSLYFTTGT